MILIYIILILMIGGILSLILRRNPVACKWIALLAVLADFIMMAVYWIINYDNISVLKEGAWIADIKKEWIPQWGASFHFAMDGLSLIMVVLTLFLGVVAVLVTWKKTIERVGFFYLNILWLLAGVLGVFLSLDLFLFYFFWELMLIPMFFIISIWGHEKRNPAAVKFFLFTQGGGVLMLIAILALYFIHGRATGDYTFDYFELLGTQVSPKVALWLMLGFLAAFVVKLPVFPFHSWLPDAYTESPTSGTIILAGLLSKTAAYGMLRFILPLFPAAAQEIAPYAVIVGVVSILYGAKLAFAQTNLKRLVAFTSMSHMGFIIVGIFSFTTLAYQGVVLEMVAHGITIGALFVIAGAINDRIHTLDMDKMGGFWSQIPVMGGITTVFVLASLGLPSLGNFVAEFLILSGTFQTYTALAVLASLGLIASMIYSLVILQRIFHGRERSQLKITDFSLREKMIMGSLIIVIFWIGLFPQTIFNTVKPPVGILKTHTVFLQKDNNDSAIELNKDIATGWWGHQPMLQSGNKTMKVFPAFTFDYTQINKKAK
ncbi:MAG TPA: NADH-quinone oxidoreductase subunit M [Hanamia sp.]|nr:NADH-quinone oxidoreductase subunit M [Hanamia sp.]